MCICAACICQTGAAAEDKSAADYPSDFKKAVAVFKNIGVLESDFDMQKAAESKITRAEFSVYLANVIKYGGDVTNVYFFDVDNTNHAFGEIGFLLENGVISPAADGLFEPDAPLMAEHAAKMCLKLNGYDVAAEVNGGYPSGYLSVANRLKMMSDISDMSSLTKAEALTIIYRAMTVGIYSPTEISATASKYTEDENTLLSTYWNLYEGEGRLNAFGGESIQNEEFEESEVLIDDEKYLNTNNAELDGMLADSVEFVFSDKKNGSQKELIYAESDGTVKKTVIHSKDITSFDKLNYTIGYNENDRQKTQVLSRQIHFIYNGRPYGGTLDTIFDKYISGEIKGDIVIKISGDAEYVIADGYRTYVIGNISDKNTVLYNKFDSNDKIDLNDYKNVITKTANGAGGTIQSGVTKVLSVSESADKSIIRIVICSKAETGAVSEISDERIKINQKEYKLDKYARGAGYVSVKLSGTYSVYTDADDEVVYSESLQDVLVFGYVIDGRLDDSGFDDVINMKILTESGEIKTFKTADSVYVDGAKLSGTAIYNALCSTPDTISERDIKVRQLIRYSINSDERITKIDTANKSADEDEKTLHKKAMGINQNRFYYKSNRMGTNGAIDMSKTKIFIVPRVDKDGYLYEYIKNKGTYNLTQKEYLSDDSGNKVSEDDSMFKTNNSAYLEEEKYYSAELYQVDDDSLITDAIVCYYDKYNENGEVILIKEFSENLTDDGETATYINGYDRKGTVSFKVVNKNEIKDLKEGDLIRASYDAEKTELYDINRVYNRETGAFENRQAQNGPSGVYEYIYPWYYGYIRYDTDAKNAVDYGYPNSRQLSKGRVIKKDGTYISVDWDGDDIADETVNLAKINIFVCDEGARDGVEVRTGSTDDILDFKSSGADCSNVVIQTYYMTLRGVYVYNK